MLTGCNKTNKPEKPYNIGIVNLTPTLEGIVTQLKQSIAEEGYREGEDVIFTYYGPSGSVQNAKKQAQEMVAGDVDLIVAVLTPVASVVKQAVGEKQIPILFVLVSDPVQSGFVPSLQEPDGIMTGIKAAPISFKGLEWLMRIVPGVKKIYVPFNPKDRSMTLLLGNLKEAAAYQKVDLTIRHINSEEEVEPVLQQIPDNVQAVWELGSGYWAPYVDLFVSSPIEKKLPLVGANLFWVEQGAFMSYGTDNKALGKQTSRFVVKLLKGTSIKSLPVEVAEGFLYLNLKTADAINVTISDDALKRAEKIIR